MTSIRMPALDGTLVGDADLAVGEVAQPAVDELAGPARRAEREVVGVDGEHGQPAGDGVEGDADAGDAEPDDEDVDVGSATSSSPARIRPRRHRRDRPAYDVLELGVEVVLGDLVVDHGVRAEHEAVGGQQQGPRHRDRASRRGCSRRPGPRAIRPAVSSAIACWLRPRRVSR